THCCDYRVRDYRTDYTRNAVGRDTSTLPENFDFQHSNLNVYRIQRAVVKANFATRVGYQVLMTLKLDDGVVPFGAVAALLNAGMAAVNSSIVRADGQVY
ncbi:fimbrial assembly protein, partial [Klebsiella pneumoniae]